MVLHLFCMESTSVMKAKNIGEILEFKGGLELVVFFFPHGWKC